MDFTLVNALSQLCISLASSILPEIRFCKYFSASSSLKLLVSWFTNSESAVNRSKKKRLKMI